MSGRHVVAGLAVLLVGGLAAWIYFGAVACRDQARGTVQFVDAAGTRSYTVDCDRPANAAVGELCARRGDVDSDAEEQLRRRAGLQALSGATPSPPYARLRAQVGCGSAFTLVVDTSVASPALLQAAEAAIRGTGPLPF